jgi:hypothetical protein
MPSSTDDTPRALIDESPGTVPAGSCFPDRTGPVITAPDVAAD